MFLRRKFSIIGPKFGVFCFFLLSLENIFTPSAYLNKIAPLIFAQNSDLTLDSAPNNNSSSEQSWNASGPLLKNAHHYDHIKIIPNFLRKANNQKTHNSFREVEKNLATQKLKPGELGFAFRNNYILNGNAKCL